MSHQDGSDMGRRTVLRTIGVAGATSIGATSLSGSATADDTLPARETGELTVRESAAQTNPHIGENAVAPKSSSQLSSTDDSVDSVSSDIICVDEYCLTLDLTISCEKIAFVLTLVTPTGEIELVSGTLTPEDRTFCGSFSYDDFSGDACVGAEFKETGVYVFAEAELCVETGLIPICETGEFDQFFACP